MHKLQRKVKSLRDQLNEQDLQINTLKSENAHLKKGSKMHDIFDDGTMRTEYNSLKHQLIAANKKIQNYENGALGV